MARKNNVLPYILYSFLFLLVLGGIFAFKYGWDFGLYKAADDRGDAPILHWKFDEASGATVQDYNAANDNDGTITNAIRQTKSSMCVTGNCMYFDGAGDYVSRSNNSDVELNPGTAGFTISIWFRHPRNPLNEDRMVSRYKTNGGYILTMKSSGSICFQIDDDSSFSPDDEACTAQSFITDSAWHNVTAVKNGTTSIVVYIDGKKAGEDTSLSATNTLNGSNSDTFIGIGADGVSAPYEGFLDDFRLYNYALTENQIKTQIMGAAAGAGKPVAGNIGSPASAGTPLFANNLVGYFPMDETSANTCTGGVNDTCDASGNKQDGAWNGNATVTNAKFGKGVDFDGVDDYVKISGSRMGDPKNLTISVWANIESVDTNGADLVTLGDLVHIRADNPSTSGYLSATFHSASSTWINISSGKSFAGTGWHHFAFTFDDDNNVQRIYADGTQLAEANYTQSILWAGTDGSNDTYFGHHGDGNTTRDLNGQLDEIAIYNRALSPAEIQTLANPNPGPVVQYTFDEGTGTTINDTSGNGYTGTMTSAPVWSPGKYGQSLLFDGVDDVVTTPNDIVSYNFTAQAWVKFASLPASGTRNVMGAESSSDWYLNVSPTSACAKVSSNGGAQVCTTVAANTWYHFSIVGDGSTFTFYKNGVSVGTGAIGSFVADNIKIGSASFGGVSYANAYIDQFQLYNYAKSPKQLTEDINGGHPAPGSPVGSALAYWKFDEGANTTANNSGNQGTLLNGTLSNFDSPPSATSGWTNSGKVNKGLIFDGSDDIVNAGSDSSIDNVNPFTYCMWIYPLSSGENGFGRIVEKGDSGTQRKLFYLDAGYPNLQVVRSSTGTESQSATAVTFNSWQHLCGTYNESEGARIYLNGKEVSYTTRTVGSGSSTDDSAYNFSIGNRPTGDRTFEGKIDEVKVFNNVLTLAQIQQEYNLGKAVVYGAVSTESDGVTASYSQSRAYCVPGDTATCDPPILEYKFDENSGTTVSDTGSKAVNGTLTNSPLWVAGIEGSALKFNGTNQYVALPNDTAALQNVPAMSVEAWVFPIGTVSTTRYIIGFSRNGSTSTERMSMRLASTNGLRCEVFMPDGSTAVNSNAGSVITPNAWNHVACVFNYSLGKMTMMVNGKMVNYPGKVYTASSTSDTTSNRAAIGSRPDGGGSYFAGVIDSVRIFGYERSTDQIMMDYNKGKPNLYFKLDDCTGTTINDSSGNGTTGTLTIGALGSQTSAGTCTTSGAWFTGATGKFNNALSFDGTDDRIVTGVAGIIAKTSENTQNASWGGWYYPTSSVATKTLMHKNNELQLYTDSSSRPTCKSESNSSVATSSDALALNTWSHVFCTYDGTTLKVWINGRVMGTATHTPNTIDSSNVALYIGSTATGTQYYSGLMDEIRIYNMNLNQTQINTIMNGGFAVRY